ncbi:MAG: hypothetical protein ACI8YQ_002578 [Polaribacter sp.]|jgi:hypothetical protein
MAVNSLLLENQNGQLVNTTNEKANEFNGLGMVTDAAWNDYDNDGDQLGRFASFFIFVEFKKLKLCK